MPADAVAGPTYARFRCTTTGSVGFTGEASDGEVEDYAVVVVVPVPSISATKNDALQIDADSDTLAEPGDTLRYTIVITNSGTGDATSVEFADTPDANTALVTGSVTTSAGVVTSGNTAGDSSVSVEIGTLPAGGTVTIVFDVTIDDPLPAGVTQVVNSGTVTGSNILPLSTDDPSQPGSSDATAFAVATVPIPTLEVWAMLGLLAMVSLVGLRRIGGV